MFSHVTATFAAVPSTLKNILVGSTTAALVDEVLSYQEGRFAAVAVAVVTGGLTKPFQMLQGHYSLPEIVVPIGATVTAFSLEMFIHLSGLVPYPHPTVAAMVADHAKLLAFVGATIGYNIYKNGNKNAFFARPNDSSNAPQTAVQNMNTPRINTPKMGKSD